jgi:hypothetical protein
VEHKKKIQNFVKVSDQSVPILVTALCMACVCDRWLAGIAGSNPAGVTDM